MKGTYVYLLTCALLWADSAASSKNIRGNHDALNANDDEENDRSLLFASALSTPTTTSQCHDIVFFHVEASITPGGLFAATCHAADYKAIGELLNQKLYDIGIANVDAVLEPTTTLVASVCVDPTLTGTTTTSAPTTAPVTSTTATATVTVAASTAAATSATTTTASTAIPATTTTSTTSTKTTTGLVPTSSPKTIAPTPSPTSRPPTSAPTSAPKTCWLWFCSGGRRNLLLGTGISVQAFVYVGGGACRFCANDNADARRLGLLGSLLALTNSILSALLASFNTNVGDPVAQKLETDLESQLYYKFPCVGMMPTVSIKIDPVESAKDVGPSLACVTLPLNNILNIP